jgi:hypothetical protein
MELKVSLREVKPIGSPDMKGRLRGAKPLFLKYFPLSFLKERGSGGEITQCQ